MQRYESFENPLAGRDAQSFGSQEDRASSGHPQHGSALYDFTAGGDDEVTSSLISYCGFYLLFCFFSMEEHEKVALSFGAIIFTLTVVSCLAVKFISW